MAKHESKQPLLHLLLDGIPLTCYLVYMLTNSLKNTPYAKAKVRTKFTNLSMITLKFTHITKRSVPVVKYITKK